MDCWHGRKRDLGLRFERLYDWGWSVVMALGIFLTCLLTVRCCFAYLCLLLYSYRCTWSSKGLSWVTEIIILYSHELNPVNRDL
jgi:hypothetical protein